MRIEDLKSRFFEMYGDGEARVYFSPGRVNLIGEHTDYNGGYVFPCALSFGTYGIVRKRNDGLLRLSSTYSNKPVEVNINSLFFSKEDGWANYLKGVAYEFIKRGLTIGGAEVLIDGNIPAGAGLSSSASIELLMSMAINDMYNCGLSVLDMVLLSQRAENHFVGVNCGIMDQYSVGFGKKDHAMLLNCREVTHEYVPILLSGYKLIIANTNKQRALSDSKYNERRAECDKAVEYLKKEMNISCLGDVSAEAFDEYKLLISDPVIRKRAEHVVYEDERVLSAVKALKAGELNTFGELMTASHNSLRDLYEVTGFELDSLVEAALNTNGVIGSRMTGAGFGGCTVSIVRDESVESFIAAVGESYNAKTALTADFYVAEIGDGVRLYD